MEAAPRVYPNGTGDPNSKTRGFLAVAGASVAETAVRTPMGTARAPIQTKTSFVLALKEVMLFEAHHDAPPPAEAPLLVFGMAGVPEHKQGPHGRITAVDSLCWSKLREVALRH